MPDSGTSFTWATRAFGPWVGWMAGWGLIAATIIVLSNLAGSRGGLLLPADRPDHRQPAIADLTQQRRINIAACLVFMPAACWISYRGMQTTKKLSSTCWSAFQVLVLAGSPSPRSSTSPTAPPSTPARSRWTGSTRSRVESFSAFAAGISLSIFIFWGWDVTLTMNEETKDPEKTPGRAATLTVLDHRGHLPARRGRR